jgi:hypothetical protein
VFTRTSTRGCGRIGWAVLVLVSTGAGLVVTVATAARVEAGTPHLFHISPTKLKFGDVPVGSTTAAKVVTVTNVSGAPQTMSGSGGGVTGEFSSSQNCQGITLAAGASCQMSYAFSPTTTGAVTGSTSGTWNGQSFNVSLSGTGTLEFKIAPTKVAFGKVAVGSTSASTIQVTNLANKSVVMSGSGGGVTGEFSSSQNCQGITLAAGASCQMSYAFSPTATGAVTGSTSGTWNGQSFNVSLSGTGIA